MKEKQTIKDFLLSLNIQEFKVDDNTTIKSIELSSREEMLKYIVSQLSSTHRLNNYDCSILFLLLSKYVNPDNSLLITSATRKIIMEELEIDASLISRALKTYLESSLVIQDGRIYYLNPIYFGKGSWVSQSKAEINIKTVYDFEKYKITKTSSYKCEHNEIYEKMLRLEEENKEKERLISILKLELEGRGEKTKK